MTEAKDNLKLLSSLAPVQTLLPGAVLELSCMERLHVAVPVVTVWCISREVLR